MAALSELLKYDREDEELAYDAFIPVLEQAEVSPEKDETVLKKAFQVTKNAALKLYEEYRAVLDLYKEDNEKFLRREQEFKDEMDRVEKQLTKYQQDPNLYKIDNEIRLEELEVQNRDLKKELEDLQYKFDNEKIERDKLRTRNEEFDRQLKTYRDENLRLKEQLRDYENRKRSQYLDQDEKNKTEQGRNIEKIRKLNKQINELRIENEKIFEENERLNQIIESNKHQLKDTTVDMNNIRKDMDSLNELKMKKDTEIKELMEKNYQLKYQLDELNSKLLGFQNQDVMISDAQNRIIHLQSVNQEKDKEIERLKSGDKFKKTDGQMLRMQMQLNKALSDLKKKDTEIEVLKKEYEDFTREMDKNAAVMDNWKKTIQENSKMLSGNNQLSLNKQFEQKITFYENRLRESETRVRELEEQAAVKEKELVEALTRIRDYESGDYQLQQAVAEIKALKGQIKVRDRDIQNLINNVNKLDVTLNEVLDENDDFRAKLGLGPKEKLDLDELNNLRAIRAQENRVQIYVLQRENENLLEVQNQLRSQIRKLAKQIRSKEVVASILEDDFDYYDLVESKPDKLAGRAAGGQPAQVVDPKVIKENDLMKRRNEHLLQILFEFENENKLMGKGLVEIDEQIKKLNAAGLKSSKGGRLVNKENIIKCPSLEKLLNEIENHRAMRSNMKAYSFLNKILLEGGGADAINLALKSEIDYLLGRNEELRSAILQQKGEIKNGQANQTRLQDEVDRLKGDVRLMNYNSAAKDIFHPFKLPEGMTPSSQDIISALNEYLIDTLQELDEYKKLGNLAEKELETLKRKYAVARHQVSLLYKDYIEENQGWKREKEALNDLVKKLNDTIAIDSVKLQEYDRLLEVLQKDEPEIRRIVAESSRQMFVVRESEKRMQRKCAAYEEMSAAIVKENKKLKVELIETEIAIQQRLGYLERYKDLAHFRITSLQKQLEESVPIAKLETVNREYDQVVHNYRQLLDKQEKSDETAASLRQTEQLNKKYENEIEFLRRELENQKDKANILDETLNRMKTLGLTGEGNGLARGLESDHSVVSMAKRLTALEMKELNERQKADHAQRMYDQQRNLLREIENRNLELENNFTQLSKKYIDLEKSEHGLREQLTHFVPKSINDQDKARIRELERQEMLLKLEVSRLRELTEITLYQNASIEFINNVARTQMESFNLIDIQSLNDDTDKLGRLHRQLILVQISEATAVRKLQQSQGKCKKLEAQLIRTEQKHDRDNAEFFTSKREYISKISYLRATVQDLRHKYAGSIPLKQQERLAAARAQVADMRKELGDKLARVNEQKYELDDKIAEYELKSKEMDVLKSAALVATDGSGIVRFNQKFLDAFRRSEGIKMLNLKLDRANRRLKDEIKFLEEINRKHEIAIIALEEDNLRMETDFDAKLLVWEHREADLERSIEHLRRQHEAIESLAISFEEVSGHMPDPSLPIASQLDQAMDIIRSHIKLLAEAKVQSDLSKKRIGELEDQARKLETELNIRDKVIAELRLRLPATEERDLLIKSTMAAGASGEIGSNPAPVKAAQATIESLQNRLKQKDETIVKYQDMLKLARDEITNMNKQHEVEINNLIDKLNLTRDTNIDKLRQEMRLSSNAGHEFLTRAQVWPAQLNKLQELEEVTVEQENTISALNQKVRKLNTEIDTWKARHELLTQQSAQDLAKARGEQLEKIEQMKQQMEEFRARESEKEAEIGQAHDELERQKQELGKSPSAEMRALVEKLKSQLAEKEEQHRKLTQAMNALKGDMVDLSKANLAALSEENSQERRIREIVEKTSGEYQDKIMKVSEELVELKRQLKQSEKTNDELKLELDYVKSQLKTKEAKMKKLTDENKKLTEDGKFASGGKSLTVESRPTEVEGLKRQVRLLEERLRKQKQSVAEKPYSEMDENKSRSKSPKGLSEPSQEAPGSLKYQLDQYKTRYNYVLSENAILKREKYDLEIEIERLKRELSLGSANVLNENKVLRGELEKLRGRGGAAAKTRSFSPGSKSPDLRAENKNQLLLELKKLTEENIRLREKASMVDALQKNVDLLKAKAERYENDDAASSGSASSIRKIGESGKSPKELEKTIALMRKIILKLQTENENLKKQK